MGLSIATGTQVVCVTYGKRRFCHQLLAPQSRVSGPSEAFALAAGRFESHAPPLNLIGICDVPG